MKTSFPLGHLVKFLSTDLYSLEGFLKDAQQNTNSNKIALLHIHGLHSGWSSSTGLTLFSLSENIFLINTRGAGLACSIKKNIDGKKHYLTTGSAFEKFEDCIKDITGAIDFLKTQGYKKIILSGHSTGCQKIIFTQLQQPVKEVVGLVLLAPADDLNLNKQLFKNSFTEKLKKAKSINHLNPNPEEFNLLSGKRFWEQNNPKSIEGNLFNYTKELSFLKKINIPILSIFGKEEQYAVISPDLMLKKIQKYTKHSQSEIKLIAGDHSFTDEAKELIKTIQTWMKKIKSYNN